MAKADIWKLNRNSPSFLLLHANNPHRAAKQSSSHSGGMFGSATPEFTGYLKESGLASQQERPTQKSSLGSQDLLYRKEAEEGDSPGSA